MPRLAPIPRSLVQNDGRTRAWSFCKSAPRTCHWVGTVMGAVAAGVGRTLTVIPVLELLGIALLVLLLGS